MIDERSGIKLLGFVDAFDNACGVLLSQLRPPSVDAAYTTARWLRMAITAMADVSIGKCKKLFPEPLPGSLEQERRNYTIGKIRQIRKKYLKVAHRQLMKQAFQ